MAGILGTYFNGQNSPEEYTNAFNQTNKALQNQQGLNNQYAGNQGYQNSINQGLSGAAVQANQAGQQAQKAARNAGMSKAQAAALGSQGAANAYAQNFGNQQNLALQTGQNAIGANQGLISGYNSMANLAQSEAQRKWGNAANAVGTIGNLAMQGGKLLTGLSDENTKKILEESDGISKMIEDIDSYIYKYKEDAQEEYPNETNDEVNVGPTAQDLEKNPVTSSAVETDESGIKHVDTNRLALSEMAIIADLARRLADLEEKE